MVVPSFDFGASRQTAPGLREQGWLTTYAVAPSAAQHSPLQRFVSHDDPTYVSKPTIENIKMTNYVDKMISDIDCQV
jgi:hypothetical protein